MEKNAVAIIDENVHNGSPPKIASPGRRSSKSPRRRSRVKRPSYGKSL